MNFFATLVNMNYIQNMNTNKNWHIYKQQKSRHVKDKLHATAK